jgi:mRNA interferase MazF
MIRRGAVVLTTIPGDYGKRRPAVVVQSDLAKSLESTIICAITSFHEDASDVRVTVEPSDRNGLLKRSYVMVEKLFTVRREKLQVQIGHMEDEVLAEIVRSLSILLETR